MAEHFSKEQVLKIAHLARLALTDDEVTHYQDRMGKVLQYIAELEKIDVSQVGLPRHIPDDVGGLREDEAVSHEARPQILENSPAMSEGAFLLPTILEEG